LPALLLAAAGADWPQFLGPRRNGVSAETGLNLDWKAKPPKTLWKVPLSPGFSALAVAGDRVVTAVERGDRDFLVCLGADDGKEQWACDAAPAYIDRQHAGPGPRSTPTVAGGKVYCLFPHGDLVCATLEKGELVWKKNILEETKTKERADEFYYWGLSASPLVEGDLVIVQPGGNKDNSVIAFDKDNGRFVWGVGNDPSCYSSPIAIDACKRRMVVCQTGKSVLGIDPAKGELLWRCEFGAPFDAACATPVWDGETLFVSAAYGGGTAALEITADGDKVGVREKWRNKSLQSVFATSIVKDGFVYGCHGDNGPWSLRCLDLKTGEVKWQEKSPCRCSFVSAEGCLFSWGERGTLQLIELNPDKLVVKCEMTDLLAFKAWPMPALANKRLYLRDDKNALCLDLSNG
jgi:outer membrane protein assembly factor BamB